MSHVPLLTPRTTKKILIMPGCSLVGIFPEGHIVLVSCSLILFVINIQMRAALKESGIDILLTRRQHRLYLTIFRFSSFIYSIH